jgi:hypothetical protein
MPAVGFYAGGNVLGQLLVFGVRLCDTIMARCSQYAVHLTTLLNWAGAYISSWLRVPTDCSLMGQVNGTSAISSTLTLSETK